jgi:hypothetical protein
VQYDCEDVEIFYVDTDGDYVSTVFHPKFFVIIYCLCPLIRSLFQFQITCSLYYLKGAAMVMILGTARTARFSKKSPWSVFFRGEMSVICHKITVKCR